VTERNLYQLSLKIPKGLIEKIDKDIEETRDFRNRSEYIVAALRHYQEHRTKIRIEEKNKAEESDFITEHRKGIQNDVK